MRVGRFDASSKVPSIFLDVPGKGGRRADASCPTNASSCMECVFFSVSARLMNNLGWLASLPARSRFLDNEDLICGPELPFRASLPFH